MAEWYKPTPLAERPSENLGFRHFARRQLGLLLLNMAKPIIGFVGGNYIEQRWKIKHLDIIGGLIGSSLAAYSVWKHTRSMQVGVLDMYEDLLPELQQLDKQHMTDERLQEDSALVRRMITHERKKQAKIIAGREGQTSHVTRAESREQEAGLRR